MATVLLARHGETRWNREGRVQGWAPTALTDRGREQARALGAWLTDEYAVDRVVASDLRRARETAAVAADAGTLPTPVHDEGWRERGFGVYQGFLAERLFERLGGGGSVSALDADPEGGERIEQFVERVRTARRDLQANVPRDETVLVVTHGGVIKLLLADLDGREPAAALAEHSQDNCALNEIRLDGPALVRRGVTAWREGGQSTDG